MVYLLTLGFHPLTVDGRSKITNVLPIRNHTMAEPTSGTWRAIEETKQLTDDLRFAVYASSLTALDAIIIAVLASEPGAESLLAMVIQPNG